MALLMVAIFPLAGVGQSLQMKYFQGRSEKDKKDNENAGRVQFKKNRIYIKLLKNSS